MPYPFQNSWAPNLPGSYPQIPPVLTRGQTPFGGRFPTLPNRLGRSAMPMRNTVGLQQPGQSSPPWGWPYYPKQWNGPQIDQQTGGNVESIFGQGGMGSGGGGNAQGMGGFDQLMSLFSGQSGMPGLGPLPPGSSPGIIPGAPGQGQGQQQRAGMQFPFYPFR